MRTRIGLAALVLVALLGLGCAQANDSDPATGDGLHATVPDVVGMSVDQARNEIESAGYQVGDVSPSDAGTVTVQEPPAGVSAPRGDVVDLEVGE